MLIQSGEVSTPGEAKWAGLARSFYIELLSFIHWNFTWNFMWREKSLLCWQCFQTINKMHCEPDPPVETSQAQKRNKNARNHFLDAPATTWILGKASPLRRPAIAGCCHWISRRVLGCRDTFAGSSLSQDLGASPSPLSLPPSPGPSNFVCATASFAAWISS